MISPIINTNCFHSLSIRAFLFSNKSQSGSLKHHLNRGRLPHFLLKQRTHHTHMPCLPPFLMAFLLPKSSSIFPSFSISRKHLFSSMSLFLVVKSVRPPHKRYQFVVSSVTLPAFPRLTQLTIDGRGPFCTGPPSSVLTHEKEKLC